MCTVYDEVVSNCRNGHMLITGSNSVYTFYYSRSGVSLETYLTIPISALDILCSGLHFYFLLFDI